MAGTIQVPQVLSDAGVTPTDVHAALASANEIPGNSRVVLDFACSSTGTTVTIKGTANLDGNVVGDRVITIGTAGRKVISAIPPSVFEQPDNNFEVDIATPGNITTAYIYQVP